MDLPTQTGFAAIVKTQYIICPFRVKKGKCSLVLSDKELIDVEKRRQAGCGDP